MRPRGLGLGLWAGLQTIVAADIGATIVVSPDSSELRFKVERVDAWLAGERGVQANKKGGE